MLVSVLEILYYYLFCVTSILSHCGTDSSILVYCSTKVDLYLVSHFAIHH